MSSSSVDGPQRHRSGCSTPGSSPSIAQRPVPSSHRRLLSEHARLGEKSNDPLAMYLADIYTVTADLAGIPGISIPCGETSEKLPIGLQILGKHFDESTILRIAHAYEQAA